MNTTRKPRRIRVAQCPNCGHLFKLRPRTRWDDKDLPNIQQCGTCFYVHHPDALQPTLEYPAVLNGN